MERIQSACWGCHCISYRLYVLVSLLLNYKSESPQVFHHTFEPVSETLLGWVTDDLRSAQVSWRSSIFLPKPFHFYFLLGSGPGSSWLLSFSSKQTSDLWSNAVCSSSWTTVTRTRDVLCPSRPRPWHFPKACPSHILLMTASFYYDFLLTSAVTLPLQTVKMTASKALLTTLLLCILPQHTVKVISWPPLQHPVMLPSPRLVHISLCYTPLLIPALTAHSFLCPGLAWLCFSSWDLLYLCLFWTRFCDLEFVITSLQQHKPKLAPQIHLCSDPSTALLKALDMCFSLQALSDTQKSLCWICYKNLNTRAQTSTTQGLLLALNREIQSHKSHKKKTPVSSHA